ncbi:MAG: hypothetical protein A3D92_11585 [Bacteroidetes bacterium RIFCSPHIGHO2_02_FULL_44_7]|nr:MAG: hypothetical protein A3D92_11585 [Bacteroidetes bacterium RIFCSPHIGHO2_02_FULL_44_7]
MKNFLGLIIVLTLLSSCGGDVQSAYDAITAKEDSISVASEKLPNGEILPEEDTYQLITLLLNFSKDYPDDIHAAECLDKVHMAYSGLRDYKKAVFYADKLLKEYPDYINKSMVLESQAGNYDLFIVPRDTSKVRYYYDLLLKEDISSEKRKDIKNRLKHIDLTMEQYILQQ